jgi:hypothetical protein
MPAPKLQISKAQNDFWKKYLDKNVKTPKGKIEVGNIYIYPYEAKTYNKGRGPLKYYDAYPLVLVIGLYHDGWLGLSLHYLPPATREYFIKKIIILNYKRLKAGQEVYLPYDLLKSIANAWFREGITIVRRYLADYVRGRPAKIEWTEWFNIVSGEGAQWINASSAEVYTDIKKSLQNVHRAASLGKQSTKQPKIPNQAQIAKSIVKKRYAKKLR